MKQSKTEKSKSFNTVRNRHNTALNSCSQKIIHILGEIEKDKDNKVIGCIYGMRDTCIYCKQFSELREQENARLRQVLKIKENDFQNLVKALEEIKGLYIDDKHIIGTLKRIYEIVNKALKGEKR